MRSTELEDSKSWKAAEGYWLKLQVEKGWALCLKTWHSALKAPNASDKARVSLEQTARPESTEGDILIIPPAVSLGSLQGTTWGDVLKQ